LVGAFFAILPLLAVGLLNGSLGLSILASLCTIVILSGLELFVEPKLFHRRQYNSTTTVLLMLIFVEDFGLVGLNMAPPIAAALQIFFNHWLKHTTTAVPKKPNVDVSLLKERYEKMLTKQEENGEELNPALENLTHRLEKLLKEAESFTAPP
jgi:predicted PurR-regulated permease PerM